jgi:hypothetical protein
MRKQELPSFAVAEGQVQRFLELADKAAESGKWDKALAYATLARAWQEERLRLSA